MKIVTWNCNGAFRKKIDSITTFDADIYIIQECENPDLVKYPNLTLSYHWVGENKNKGLGIFYKDNLNITNIDNVNDVYRDRKLKWFKHLYVEGYFNLLAVWTHKNDAKYFPYIGQFWLYMQQNKDLFKSIVIAGDFNSNVQWDTWDRWWNHSDCVRELEELKINSIYHHIRNEEQGKEAVDTLYHMKNKDKSYHIDYIFADNKFCKETKSLEVGTFEDWIELSDHVPLIWELSR